MTGRPDRGHGSVASIELQGRRDAPLRRFARRCADARPLGRRMTTAFTESVVEEAALAGLGAAGWQVAHGPGIAPDTPAAERADFGEVVLGAATRCAHGAAQSRAAGRGAGGRFRKADATGRRRAGGSEPGGRTGCSWTG